MRSQIGAARELAFGTYAAPTRFFEFVSETLNRNKRAITSEGHRASASPRLQRSNRRKVTGWDVTGNTVMEVGFDGFGLWLEQMLGAVATVQPDDVAAPTVYEHTFTLGSHWDKSLTIQKGIERDDSTVQPYSFLGCKIPSWQLELSVDGFLRLTVDVDGRDATTAEALVPSTYDGTNLADFMQGTLTLGGDAVAMITAVQLSGTTPMKTDRYYIGQGGLKAQQRENGTPQISGQFTADFVADFDINQAYHADEALELVLSFEGDVIEDVYSEELQITVDDIRLGGETPKANGAELPQLTIPFAGLDDGVGAGIEVLLRNTDATA